MTLRIFWLLVLVAMAGLTVRRVVVFHDNLSLWREAVQVAPCSARAHANLAAAETDPLRQQREWQATIMLSIHEDPSCP